MQSPRGKPRGFLIVRNGEYVIPSMAETAGFNRAAKGQSIVTTNNQLIHMGGLNFEGLDEGN